MKKLLMIFLLLANAVQAKEAWTPLSNEQREIQFLMEQCDKIWESYVGRQAFPGLSSAPSGILFKYLKDIGTPASFKVLKNQIAKGRIPANFLQSV